MDFEKSHILSFSDYRSGNTTRTNIICIPKKSSDLIINHLIEDVNSLYNKIIHVQDEYDIELPMPR